MQRAGMANGAAVVERARRLYSIKVDLKKVDVGGGLITATRAIRGDASGKQYLAHIVRADARAQGDWMRLYLWRRG